MVTPQDLYISSAGKVLIVGCSIVVCGMEPELKWFMLNWLEKEAFSLRIVFLKVLEPSFLMFLCYEVLQNISKVTSLKPCQK